MTTFDVPEGQAVIGVKGAIWNKYQFTKLSFILMDVESCYEAL